MQKCGGITPANFLSISCDPMKIKGRNICEKAMREKTERNKKILMKILVY